MLWTFSVIILIFIEKKYLNMYVFVKIREKNTTPINIGLYDR